MIRTARLFPTVLLAAALPGSAADLVLPEGAQLSAERQDGFTSQRLPIGAYTHPEVPAIWAEGDRRLQAWQAENTDQTTLQILSPLRDQLAEQGYDLLFECRDADCGGFDFRFAQETLPEPDMHVNLGDYRFLSAQRMTDDGPEYVALLVSRNRAKAYVHVTTIGSGLPEALTATVTSTKNDPLAVLAIEPDQAIGTILERDGVAVLEDLDFSPGSADLTDGDYGSLAALADYLIANPAATISLVGHTDAMGSMEANFKLSKARAAAVRDLIVARFGVQPDQIDAQGVGYLAPVASNLTDAGRSLNRRVEVVLTSTQ